MLANPGPEGPGLQTATRRPGLQTSTCVVLVHDWLTGMRGGEMVLEALCRIFPSADLLTLVHVPGTVSPLIESRAIRTSVVQRLPNPARWYRHYLPLYPTAVELFDLDDVDLVISTSHCAAKSVVPTGRALHICYCHTPMRYVWDQFDAYFGPERIGRLPSAAARHVARWLAAWDRQTAARVDRFVANSRHVAGRIARYYNRPATVVHPPVDTGFFTPGPGRGPQRGSRVGDSGRAPQRGSRVGDPGPSGDAFLVVSALVPYKRIEIAIRAAMMAGARLKVVGTGPDEARLRTIAGPGIEFLGTLSSDALRDAYRSARALVLPGEEDFGIAPVESLACGRPVIALARGGACETVEPEVTGLLVHEPTADAFAAAMRELDGRAFEPDLLRARAERFSAAHFEASFREVLKDTLTNGAGW